MATKTEKNVQLKINKMTKNIFDQLSVQGLISEDELYLLPEDEETGSATWGNIGGELSNQTDLKVMLDSKADKSEIPTVNNPTITFTQGNAVKGSITLNQANDQTISLDAGGGGGSGDIPADLSCNNLSAANSVSLWGAPGARATNLVLIGLPGKISTPNTTDYRTIVINTHNSSIASAHGAGTLNICCGNSGNGDAETTAANIFLGNKNNAISLDGYISYKAAAASGDKLYFVEYSPDTWRQEGSYILLNTGYTMYSQGLIYFTVKAQNTVSFTISWTDSKWQQLTESFDLVNEQNYPNACMQFLIFCNFLNTLEITSNDGKSMTVDVYYKIEVENVHN